MAHNTKGDREHTARVYVDAILEGRITRERAIEELTAALGDVQWFEHERVREWLRRRNRSHGDSLTAIARRALSVYLATVRAR